MAAGYGEVVETLEAAEKRIEILVADREDGAAEPFDHEDDFEDEDWDDDTA